MEPYLKNGEEVGNALIRLIEENLAVKGWNFRITFTRFANPSDILIIYDSGWCRVSFMFSRQQKPRLDELSIDYGRLHAPNEEPFMMWEGQQCHCWHNIHYLLRFLDGFSPADAVEHEKAHGPLSRVAENFWQSNQGKKLREEYPPKYAIVLHSLLWEHYGQRLFELLDLRRPDLWEQYRHFNKEYHRLMGTKTIYGPPPENIC